MTTTGIESVNARVDEPLELSSPLRRAMGRRGFLTKGLAVVGLGTVLPAAFVQATFAEGTPSGVASRRRALVVVQLGGGNDGLNTIIPYNEGLYFDARPRIGIKQDAVLTLDSQVAMHPEMASLKALYDRGQVAVVQGVGYPDPNRSHFRSMEIWHTASMDEYAPNGWLGRLLDATRYEQSAHWRAANIGSELPESLLGDHSFVPSLASVQSYGLQTDPAARTQAQRRITDWVRLYASQAALGGALALVSETGTEAYRSSLDLGKNTAAYQPLATYPGNALGTALKTSAQLLTANLGTGICYVTTGGFDSHAGQANTQPGLLRAVSDSIAAFYADLAARGMDGDVLTMVWTEFGRRVRENASGGTDHGTAGPVFLVGGGVKGGLYGETPSLKDLDNGDLKFNTDFRSVYATILERWFQTDPKDVLGNGFSTLPVFA